MMVRRVVGQGVAAPLDIFLLAKAIADDAVRLGFQVISVERTRSPTSPTRYVYLRDQNGREWQMRISQHRRPGNTRYADPHLDLVTLDGTSGRTEAHNFLLSIVHGEANWHARLPRRSRGR